MERTTVDSKRFDGLARTVADRGAERTRDSDQFEALTRLVATKGSRRVALAGLLGAVLLGHGAQPTAAQCRAKEGKEKRQCRRRQRRNTPRGGASPTCGLAGQLCGDLLGVECCGPFKCTTTLGVISNCVLPCTSDEQCRKQFPNNQVACRADLLTCPFISGGKCCATQDCLFDSDCASPFTCQGGTCKR